MVSCFPIKIIIRSLKLYYIGPDFLALHVLKSPDCLSWHLRGNPLWKVKVKVPRLKTLYTNEECHRRGSWVWTTCLPRVVTQPHLAVNRTRDLLIASPTPYHGATTPRHHLCDIIVMFICRKHLSCDWLKRFHITLHYLQTFFLEIKLMNKMETKQD